MTFVSPTGVKTQLAIVQPSFLNFFTEIAALVVSKVILPLESNCILELQSNQIVPKARSSDYWHSFPLPQMHDKAIPITFNVALVKPQ